MAEWKGSERRSVCQVPCEKVQQLSEMMAEMTPNLQTAMDGVANFRSFQTEVREFIIRQDERSRTVAEHLVEQAQKDTGRRKTSQWRLGILAIGVLAMLGFLGQKAWDQITILTRLEDDWIRYYQTPPVTPPVAVPQEIPLKPHKSYFAQPHKGVSFNQEPPQMNAGNESRNP